ncbi:ankyrin repeat domain-containing protein [Geomonas sp. Red32]|uniref:ankyrin repeat domain-containing protein n=1 Tax=Geomonas sp. Red32 TaxID=2912856 RepID=UPI00202CF796|nr:ankyrin repeat domain-containing protein [Geomonas sp. Red32]MCM0083043.1 ankyrin repeat domain-containing protein [Geomonas sp. Red32]
MMAPEFFPFFACALALIVGIAFLLAARFLPRQRKTHIFLGTASLIVAAIVGLGVRKAFFIDEPMAIAAGEGDFANVSQLLAKGASPDATGPDGVSTALVSAAAAGHTEVVKLLLEKGARPELPDSAGKTAIQRAQEAGHPSTAEVLKEAMRDPRRR